MRRLERPDKHWKYNPNDVAERALWPKYMEAYQTVFERTSTNHAPWYVVPADHKWVRDVAVASVLVDVFTKLDPQIPDPEPGLEGLVVD
jgi:polyphosphate kinase 2 (PPK2 family)